MTTAAPAGASVTYGGFVDLARDAEQPARYRGICHPGTDPSRGYGGSVAANALAAAADTVEPTRGVHSLHGYFLLNVDPTQEAVVEVTTLRDGQSYSLRQADAWQAGKHVFTMTASFKTPGPQTHVRLSAPPDGVRPPEELPDGFAGRPAGWPVPLNMDYRDGGAIEPETPGELARAGWFRIKATLGDDLAANACALVYLSDTCLAPTVFLRDNPRGWRPDDARIGSLDHAMWFHRPVRAEQWLLYVMRSRLEADGRTFARGEFFTSDGELVATVAQEALLRFPG